MAAAARQTMPAPDAPPRSTTLPMVGFRPRYSAIVAGTCCGVSPTCGPTSRPSIS